ADFERARLTLKGAPGPDGDADGTMTLAEFWPVWVADAKARIRPRTVMAHERVWRNRVEPRFADMQLRAIKPRMVAQWRSQLLDEDVGEEAMRKALTLLQAIFTVGVEWGEADTNPVRNVRKPRQGRKRVIEPLPPEPVEAIRAWFLKRGEIKSATLVVVLAYS